ncbi:MAG: hypothetical protein ABSE16_11880 [Verrucomicrobiota bacterium]|jgi:hypothetical protein
MTGSGKIARLPRAIRDELNRRMDDGQTGNELLHWLNGLPKVKKVLAKHFAGRPIAKQNLYEWRIGGHLAWLHRQEAFDTARDLATDGKKLDDATERKLADRLGTVLAARYTTVLADWNGGLNDKFRRQLRLLRGLCQEITCLRRADHSGGRLALQQQRLESKRGKTDEEMREQFECWLSTPAGRKWKSEKWMSPKEAQRRIREIYRRV